MGSQLTKAYDIEKEPVMHGGIHALWPVYRAQKKQQNQQECSIFMFDKKSIKAPKTQAGLDLLEIVKRDATNLAKFKHPGVLNLVESPIEDKAQIAFVTEPVTTNLAGLSMRGMDLIPSEVEVKCMVLELMECVNFLHSGAKHVHLNLAPENLYLTKQGKLKVAGFNFIQPFQTIEPVALSLDFALRIGDFAMVPNLKFAAPEVTASPAQCSAQSDIFSIGCLIYFLMRLSKGKHPYYLVDLREQTNKQMHVNEFGQGTVQLRLQKELADFDGNLQQLIRQMVSQDAGCRGQLGQHVQNVWFQDPQLKTIRFLENINQKEEGQKVQFLQGVSKILDKFEKKTLLNKVVPPLLEILKDPKQSTHVLPNVFLILQKENYVTTTQFRDIFWPHLCRLCQQKELPAQSLYLLLKHADLFLKFVNAGEFNTYFMPLIQKSLECGVAKLQLLSLSLIPGLFKKLDYATFKTAMLPRVMMALEKSEDSAVKIRVLATIQELQDGIDQQTLSQSVLKTLEKVRQKETDPEVCMMILQIYEKASEVLGPDEIGLKILPSIIPMMVSASLSRSQFQNIMSSVRRLLDVIETQRLATLPEGEGPKKNDMFDEPFKQPDIKKENNNDLFATTPQPQDSNPFNADPFVAPPSKAKVEVKQPAKDPFVGADLFGGIAEKKSQPMTLNKPPSAKPAPAQTWDTNAFGSAAPVKTADLFGSADLFAASKTEKDADPFANAFGGAPAKPAEQQKPFSGFGDFGSQPAAPQQQQNTFDLFGGASAQQPKTDDPFSSFNQPTAQQPPPQKNNDPFAGFGF